MADKITTTTRFPPTKSQLYSATRSTYHPQSSKSDRRKRGLCCTVFLWATAILLVLLLLAAAFFAILFLIYRPHLPTFSLSSVSLSHFTVSSSSSSVNSKINLTISSKNPNSKLAFIYDPIHVSVIVRGVDVADGVVPGYVHGKKNTTTVRVVVGSGGDKQVEGEDVKALEAADKKVKSSGGAEMEVKMEAKVKVMIGKWKTPRLVMRVRCKGVRVSKKTTASSTAVMGNRKCGVALKGRVWKWTI